MSGHSVSLPRTRFAIEMVLPTLDPAGMEIVTASLARGLAGRGHRVGITCLEREGPLAEALVRFGIKVRVVPCPGLSPNVYADPQLSAHFKQIAPDIVHAHSGVWSKAALAARAAHVPSVIHTAHGLVHSEPFYAGMLRWWAARHTDLIVAVSQPLEDYLVRRARISKKRVTTLINGVDVVRFSPGPRSGIIRQSYVVPMDALLIGCVARFDPVKNQPLLLKAFALLQPEFPNCWLALVGAGPTKDLLLSMTKELGVTDRVIFAGEYSDISPVYRDFDLFVLPSVYEGTSMSILEAMASGVPIVATAVGGSSDLLDDGKCGELVPSGDVKALARALRRILGNDSYRDQLRSCSRVRALANFSEERMVLGYEQLYSGLRSAPKANPAR